MKYSMVSRYSPVCTVFCTGLAAITVSKAKNDTDFSLSMLVIRVERWTDTPPTPDRPSSLCFYRSDRSLLKWRVSSQPLLVPRLIPPPVHEDFHRDFSAIPWQWFPLPTLLRVTWTYHPTIIEPFMATTVDSAVRQHRSLKEADWFQLSSRSHSIKRFWVTLLITQNKSFH